MKDDSVYLRHILEAIARIEENISGGKATFLASHTLQDATLRNLQTMAEATQRLSAEAKASEVEVDWRALSGFRNVLKQSARNKVETTNLERALQVI